ncbi:MAG: translesion DNA synthesis-associated protein ImuA [Gammaproteobacteria bacterium]
MNDALRKLLQNPRVWQGQSTPPQWQGLASGYAKLDQHLPGGGWPLHALTEILLEHYGTGELQLLMPALARLSQSGLHTDSATETGWIAWISPPFEPYPPALLQWGVNLSRVLLVRPKVADEALWAAEQALASGNCAAVLLWSEVLDDAASRRLQLAAEKGRSWAIAFRSLKARAQSSAAALRIELMAGKQGTDLGILKSRGGRPALVRDYAG